MGIGVSLVLIAIGAVLKWAVTATASGVNLATVGVVLMIVGAMGILLSLIFWSSWGGFGGRGAAATTGAGNTTGASRTTVVREDSTIR